MNQYCSELLHCWLQTDAQFIKKNLPQVLCYYLPEFVAEKVHPQRTMLPPLCSTAAMRSSALDM